MKFTTNNIKVLKEKIKLSDLLKHFKIELKERGNEWVCCCLFHEEKTPSMYLNDEKGVYHCFGCGAKGDVIDLAQHLFNCSFKDAIKHLEELSGANCIQNRPIEQKKKNTSIQNEKEKLSANYLNFYNDSFFKNKEQNYSYLLNRGISVQVQQDFLIGFQANWIHPNCTSCNIASSRLIIPRASHTYLARATNTNINKQYQKQIVGSCNTLFNYPWSFDLKRNKDNQLDDTGIVFVVEGEIDCLSIAEILGVLEKTNKRHYNLVGLGSTSNAQRFVEEALEYDNNIYVLMLDNDAPGIKATHQITDAFDNADICYLAPKYPGDDVNNSLVNHHEKFKKIVWDSFKEARAYRQLYEETMAKILA